MKGRMWARTENSGKYLNSSWLPSFPGTLSQCFMQSSRALETVPGRLCAGDEHGQGRCCWCQSRQTCAWDSHSHGTGSGCSRWPGTEMPLAGQGQELLGWERSWENLTLSMRDEGPAGSRSCSGEGSE